MSNFTRLHTHIQNYKKTTFKNGGSKTTDIISKTNYISKTNTRSVSVEGFWNGILQKWKRGLDT